MSFLHTRHCTEEDGAVGIISLIFFLGFDDGSISEVSEVLASLLLNFSFKIGLGRVGV